MIKTRVNIEMEETLRENELEAASALVLLNKRSVQKRKREERKKPEVTVNTVARRSTRIANKK
jgi:fructose-specific phosphotransferase system component IIB